MNQQLTALELGVMSSNSNSVKTRPFVLKNDTAVNLKSLSVLIVLYDAENEQVGKEYLYVGSDIPSGTEIEADQHIISTRFDHFEFEYEYNISGTISGETYYELRSAKAVPTEQFGWNGIVLKDGKPAPGQPVFVIEDLTAVWDYKSSRNNALYVPTLRFAVKNIGDTESDGVRVDVVFTNTDQNEVWSEETDYVVGMTDAELKPGYSKKTVVYSSEGSDPDSDSLPSITADIFINGVPAGTVDIAGKASTDDGQ